MHNYEEILHELIEIFYYYKNETLDLMSDDELIQYMKKSFDGICQGSLDLLCGRELDRLARNLHTATPLIVQQMQLSQMRRMKMENIEKISKIKRETLSGEHYFQSLLEKAYIAQLLSEAKLEKIQFDCIVLLAKKPNDLTVVIVVQSCLPLGYR